MAGVDWFYLMATLGTSALADLATFDKMDNDLEGQWLWVGPWFTSSVDGFSAAHSDGGKRGCLVETECVGVERSC